jgi:hypothetical protein
VVVAGESKQRGRAASGTAVYRPGADFWKASPQVAGMRYIKNARRGVFPTGAVYCFIDCMEMRCAKNRWIAQLE